LRADVLLPFNHQELKELIQMDAASWQQHCQQMQEKERYLFMI